jgi:hypothetical protein
MKKPPINLYNIDELEKEPKTLSEYDLEQAILDISQWVDDKEEVMNRGSLVYEETVFDLMGTTGYPKDECISALSMNGWNVDRAVAYLTSPSGSDNIKDS